MALSMMPSKKNWAVVRRMVGYDRLELPALPALERIHDLARDYVNFVHPVRKLMTKTSDGARVRRSYDAASTPFYLDPSDASKNSTTLPRMSVRHWQWGRSASRSGFPTITSP
jgi:hypothetical protein